MATTYHDLYLKTRMALSSAGIEAAQLEVPEILCAAAEKTAEELYRDISLYTTDAIAEKTEALQARRLAGEPIAYLLGHFTGLYVVYIFVAVQMADIIKCIIGFVLVKKGVWLQNIVE